MEFSAMDAESVEGVAVFTDMSLSMSGTHTVSSRPTPFESSTSALSLYTRIPLVLVYLVIYDSG
jgi:hypothetical protein